jgi:hypothetical protein
MRGARRAGGRAAWLLLPLLGACAGDDAWTVTRGVCGFAEGEVLPWSDSAGAGEALRIDTACGEAILADMGADVDALLAEAGAQGDLGDHLAASSGDRLADGMVVLIWGLYWLLASDYGTVGGLEVGPYVDERWADEWGAAAAALGLDDTAPLSRVLYDLSAEGIEDIVFLPTNASDEAGGGLEWTEGRYHVPREGRLNYVMGAAGAVVHETAHARSGGLPHVECGENVTFVGPYCDAALDGSYGAGFAAMWAQTGAATGGAGCVSGEDALADNHALRTEEELRVYWSASVMAALPESQLDGCP